MLTAVAATSDVTENNKEVIGTALTVLAECRLYGCITPLSTECRLVCRRQSDTDETMDAKFLRLIWNGAATCLTRESSR